MLLLVEEGAPMKLTSLFVERPICVLTTGMIILLIISLISNRQGFFELTEQNNRDFLVWDHQKVIDWDKQVAGREAILAAQGQDKKPIRIQNTRTWNPIILIKSPSESESLLKKKYLLQMNEIEKKFMDLEDWPLFCKAKSIDDSSCSDSAFLSPISYLKTFAGNNWTEKS